MKNKYQLQDTIVAQSTAPGQAAIAVVRMSGDKAIEIADEIFHGTRLSDKAGHTAHYGKIMDANKTIDEVLITIFRDPASYTSENLVEISCHGSQFIVDKLIRLLIKKGGRMAEPGEFTLRAFLNGKLDLTQAEAVADLISAESDSAHALAMKQMRGGFSREIIKLREQLIEFASMIELELDFGEEDVEFANRSELQALVKKIHGIISNLLESYQYGKVIADGIATVIAGRPNAGKSTLLNAMLREERALVSSIEGTTRDSIEENIHLRGIKFRLIDTAGIREAADKIEKMGVARTMEQISKSTLLLYVFEIDKVSPEQVIDDLDKLEIPETQLILLANKEDLLKNSTDHQLVLSQRFPKAQFVKISAKKGLKVDLVEKAMYEAVLKLKHEHQVPTITNQRHYEALYKAEECLERIQDAISNQIPSDLIAIDIRQCLHFMETITGQVSTDNILEKIFSDFCIGK